MTPCPDPRRLAEWLAGILATDEALSSHIDGCESCQKRLLAMETESAAAMAEGLPGDEVDADAVGRMLTAIAVSAGGFGNGKAVVVSDDNADPLIERSVVELARLAAEYMAFCGRDGDVADDGGPCDAVWARANRAYEEMLGNGAGNAEPRPAASGPRHLNGLKPNGKLPLRLVEIAAQYESFRSAATEPGKNGVGAIWNVANSAFEEAFAGVLPGQRVTVAPPSITPADADDLPADAERVAALAAEYNAFIGFEPEAADDRDVAAIWAVANAHFERHVAHRPEQTVAPVVTRRREGWMWRILRHPPAWASAACLLVGLGMAGRLAILPASRTNVLHARNSAFGTLAQEKPSSGELAVGRANAVDEKPDGTAIPTEKDPPFVMRVGRNALKVGRDATEKIAADIDKLQAARTQAAAHTPGDEKQSIQPAGPDFRKAVARRATELKRKFAEDVEDSRNVLVVLAVLGNHPQSRKIEERAIEFAADNVATMLCYFESHSSPESPEGKSADTDGPTLPKTDR